MGMDYYYAGSASYSRFNEELNEVAKYFNGIRDKTSFIFPNETNKVLIKWFNNIYDFFTAEETKIIWELISKHSEIKTIARQIWYELETLVQLNEGWHII